ncbi:S8 family serine peptidase [Streptomyces sp. NPDC003023]|uniref:S8 family serine peptidase n=1 Tax=Streptomyces sp. NPDC003023 TaxID=3364675 RepID=UPI0036C3BDB7
MKRQLLAAAVVGLTIATAAGFAPASPYTPTAALRLAPAEAEPVPDTYIVRLKDGQDAKGIARALQVRTQHTWGAGIDGFVARLSSGQLHAVRQHPSVAYVQQDSVLTGDPLDSTQTSPSSWGLDRIDQRALPLSGTYTYNSTAPAVHAYVIDTGLDPRHPDFGGRATQDYDSTGENGKLCKDHGTHVAGTLGSQTYGVAKQVRLHGVKALACGDQTMSMFIDGVEWVTAHAQKPAVANMSWNASGKYDQTLNDAVEALSASGVFVAASSGNTGDDSCDISPRAADGISVVANATNTDTRSSTSSTGSCVDVYAPGTGIISTIFNGSTGTKSGTSMATPHVAGVAALYKAVNGDVPSETLNRWITDNATPGIVEGGSEGGTANRMLYVSPVFGQTLPIFSDDFETDRGWQTNPAGSDTATTGRWERGNPEPTQTTSGPLQLGTTTSGSNDLVTGRLAGAGNGTYDVDGGTTSIRSPLIALPSTGGTIRLSFSYTFANGSDSSSYDYLTVKVIGSNTTTVLTQRGVSSEVVNGEWKTATADLSAFAGQTVRLQFEAADKSTGSIVEAAVDDVIVHQ